MYGSAKLVHGDAQLAAELQRIAGARLAGPAPEVEPDARLRYESEPFDLLRTFDRLRSSDRAAAGLVLASLTTCTVDAYFALNRRWTSSPVRRLEALEHADPEIAEAVRLVCELPLADVCEDSAPLHELVHLLVGCERGAA